MSRPRDGWTRYGAPGVRNAAWRHESGMAAEHCGHPTALFPWLVRALNGDAVVAHNGRGFRLLEDAQLAAEELLAGTLVAIRPSLEEAPRALTRPQAYELARFRAVQPDGERPRGPRAVRALLVDGPLGGLEVELGDGRRLWQFPVPREDRLAALWIGGGGCLPTLTDQVTEYELHAPLGDDMTTDGRTRYHHVRGAW